MKILPLATISAAAALLLTTGNLSQAQEKETASIVASVPKQTSFLSASDLEKDAALGVKVAFEAKRMPLGQLLALLQKQSKVTVVAAPDAIKAETRVTARVKEMTLAAVMGALERIYGVRWSKTNDGYLMNAPDSDELHLKMLQTGEPFYYRFRFRPLPAYYEQIEREAALAGEVYENIDTEALKSPEGIAFSDLPADLQKRVRELIGERQSERVMEAQQLVEAALRYEPYLRFGISDPNRKVLFGGYDSWTIRGARPSQGPAALSVETAEGALITYIFRGFRSPDPPRLEGEAARTRDRNPFAPE